jgi:hypothetical protein
MDADGPNGFPRRGILRGAIQQSKSDLLSLSGAFATAVCLGLASEMSPDRAGADVGHGIIHGLLVVVGTLVALSLADGMQRLAWYRWRSRRSWTLAIADHAGLLGFGLDSLKPAIPAPESLVVLVRKPSGEFASLWPDPPLNDGFVVPYPPGRWVHLVEQPYAAGRYEVRAYSVPGTVELIRGTFEIPAR